jgi:hypothetical protein
MGTFEIIMMVIFSLIFFVPILFGDKNDDGEDDIMG